MNKDVRTTLEVGVIVTFGFLIPGVAAVLLIDAIIRSFGS